MSLDGYCDHTAMDPDIEVHQHFNDLLRDGDTLFYGRITYQLMESYWPTIVQHPTGNKTVDEFALLIDNITKVVYSHTLQQVDWKNSILKKEVLKEEVLALKQSPGSKNLLVGSPGLIVTFMQLGLVDEFQLCVHPVVIGKGLPLFKNITDRMNLKLLKTKMFRSGCMMLYYEPLGKKVVG